MPKKQVFQRLVASHLLFVIAFSPSGILQMHGLMRQPHQQQPKQQHDSSRSVRLPIILYHHIRPVTSAMAPLARDLSVTPEAFEEQLRYFKEHNYTAVSLYSFAAMLQKNSAVPDNSFALTFDDGYEDLYTHAWPLLKKYGFSATAFIIVNRVGAPDYATWDQLREMQQGGLLDIQSHTLNHPMLTRLVPIRAQEEIEQSKHILEQRLGKTVSIFCYPYGDYNEATVHRIERAGYSLALTTKGGVWHSHAKRFELPRMRLSTEDVHAKLARKIKLFFSKKTS